MEKNKRLPMRGPLPPLYQHIDSGAALMDLIRTRWPGAEPECLGEGSGKHVILFTPQGWEEYAAILHWGLIHPMNRDEQRLRGLGLLLEDGEYHYHVQSFFQSIQCPERTSVMASRASESLADLNREQLRYRDDPHSLNPFCDQYGPAWLVTSMAHTHPGDLGVFMSGTDQLAHSRACRNNAWTTLISNPHTSVIKAWCGPGQEEASVWRCALPKLKKSKRVWAGEWTLGHRRGTFTLRRDTQ